MDLPFTEKPGRRERHLLRRHENALFGRPPPEIAPEELLAAQKADHEEREAFRDSFLALVQAAVELPPNAGSDTLLGIREDLEKLYEQACSLPEDNAREKEALSKLIGLIIKAVRQAAGADPLARQELEEAEQARAIHSRLLEQPLVADILHPDTPIGTDELVPALLCARLEEVEALLEVFDADQLALLIARGRELLDRLERESLDTTDSRQRLDLLEQGLSRHAALSTDRGSEFGGN